MSEDDYYEIDVEIDLYVDRAMNAEATVTRQRELLALAAEWAYKSDVVDTLMVDSTIGPNNEYADKEDWIDSWLYGLKEELDATTDAG